MVGATGTFRALTKLSGVPIGRLTRLQYLPQGKYRAKIQRATEGVWRSSLGAPASKQAQPLQR